MNITKRHTQVLEALTVLKKATAREVAQFMVSKGYAKILERNLSHPRLSELSLEGIVEVIGTKVDSMTMKEVSVYRRVVA